MCIYIYWLNYCRKLRTNGGGENSESPSPCPVGLEAEITTYCNHRRNGNCSLFPTSLTFPSSHISPRMLGSFPLSAETAEEVGTYCASKNPGLS